MTPPGRSEMERWPNAAFPLHRFIAIPLAPEIEVMKLKGQDATHAVGITS
jgi:hypothetical protein